MLYPRSGVVLDCIDSWSLRFFLLSLLQHMTSVVKKLRIPIIPLIIFSVHEIFHHHPVMTHGGLERISLFVFFVKNRLQSINTSIVSCVYNLKTHTFYSVICGESFFIRAMCIVYVCSVLTYSIITSIENISYMFLNHVYYTSHLDIVSYPLVALCGMIVTLLGSSVSFFFLLLMGYLCLLSHMDKLIGMLFQFLFFSVASIFASRLIKNELSYSFWSWRLLNKSKRTSTNFE